MSSRAMSSHSRLVQYQAVGSFTPQGQEERRDDGHPWAGYLKQLAQHHPGTRLDAKAQERARRVLAGMQVRRDDRILNLRCGLGYDAFALGDAYQAHVDALDADPQNIALARQVRQQAGLHNVGLHNAQEVPLRFLAECFEQVLVSEPLAPEAVTEAFLGEINRVLVPGGRLVLILKQAIDAADGDLTSLVEALRPTYESMGFEVLSVEHCSGPSAAAEQSAAAEPSAPDNGAPLLLPMLVRLETGADVTDSAGELVLHARKVRRRSYHAGNGHSTPKQE